MTYNGSEAELARSIEALSSTEYYSGFWLNRRMQLPEGCIDPRDEDRPEIHVIRQTPGGATGRAVDATVALYAYDGTVVSLTDALRYDETLGKTMIATAHHSCAYNLGRASIVEAMLNPSDEAIETTRRLLFENTLQETSIPKAIEEIRVATSQRQNALVTPTPEEVAGQVKELYPGQVALAGVIGDNKAGIYVVNHHLYIGLNRKKVHRGPRPLVAQAYHDNLGATIASIESTRHLNRGLKRLRVAAAIVRTSATMQVVIGSDPRARILHVTQGDGLVVTEQDR